MSVTSFRLMIVHGSAEPFQIIEAVRQVLNRAARELGCSIQVKVNERPKFALVGEFPAGATVVEGPGESVTVHVELTGVEFVKWLRLFERALVGLVPAEFELQSDPELAPALWAFAEPFGNRTQALHLINQVSFVASASPERVNVVIVDQGFDATLFPAARFGGGFSLNGVQPGKGRSRHAAMIARNVLSVAPNAILYDCPLIPTAPIGAPQVLGDIVTFTSVVAHLCDWVATPLVTRSNAAEFGSWIFVNAWAMFDRRTDVGMLHYADSPDQLLNIAVKKLVAAGCDVVFAAGNCGQFDADIRCSFDAVGPGCSILGANSLRDVVTVGAIRTSCTPLGYCSQGPGQKLLGEKKPDLCAPSEFTEVNDKGEINGGTSAAAGMVGGVIAALREKWPVYPTAPSARTSAEMQHALITSAIEVEAFGPRYGIGAGIVDLAGADTALLKCSDDATTPSHDQDIS